jgi:hypothetical protein
VVQNEKWEPLGSILKNLGRVKPGWAGDGSVAPNDRALRDIAVMSALLPSTAQQPEVEVDADDGSIVLRWISDSREESFSLTFFGNGNAIGVLATTNGTSLPSWKASVTDFRKLSAHLLNDRIAKLVSK